MDFCAFICTVFTGYAQFEKRINVHVSNIFVFCFSVALQHAAIKDMASNVERRWRQMVSNQDGGSKLPDSNMAEGGSWQFVAPLFVNAHTQTSDPKSKKRKPTEPPPSKALPPAKKVAVSTPLSSFKPVVKKETKLVVTAVKDAKADSSFFSAPKPKPKLPSFKKAPAAPVKKEPDPNVAQPSSIDPFQEALKSMAKARKESPMVSTPPPPASSTPPGTTGLTKFGTKKKSVTWPPEGQLESIRLIEKAIYDDDPVDVSCSFSFAIFCSVS